MVNSFTDFISSRNQKNAGWDPMAGRKKQLEARRQGIKEDVYQPDPNQPSFQDSREGEKYKDQLKTIAEQAEFINPALRARTVLQQNQAAKTEQRKTYDTRIKQSKRLDVEFTGMTGSTYNPEQDSPAGFIIADKNQYVAKQKAGQINLSEELKAGDPEIEATYYQQLLQKNSIATMSVNPLNPDGSVNWEQKITQYQKQTYDLLMPVSVAGEYTNVTGYQKRALEKETGVSRLGDFAKQVSNPLNEEFLPVAAAQVLGALPGFAAKELGVATPAVAENVMKIGATAGEWVGFGVGIGSVSRSARWVAEDIALPFLAVRGTKKLVAKKFGQKGIRTAAQLDRVIAHADQVPPSVEPTESQLLETSTSPLVFARKSVGGTGSIADDVKMSANADGLLDEVTITKNNATTTYKINTADDWFNAAGDATGMSKESVEQAKRVSKPVLDALADFYDVPVDEYVRGMSPQVRSVLGDGTYAARTIPGGLGTSITEQLDAGWTVMQSNFRKIASLVEFVKKSPGLGTNQADSLVTLQHELAHVILEDIFEYSRVLGRTNDTKLADLAKTLKEQVIIRGKVSEGSIGQQQISLLNSLSVEEIGMLLNGRTPGRYMQTISEGGRNAELLISDLTTLLHEAGADLFAKYTMDMVTSARGGAAQKIAKADPAGTLEGFSIWQTAAKSLTESWDILKGAVTPAGIAQPAAGNYAEEKVVNNFVRILEDIIKSKGEFTGEAAKIRDARYAREIERMERLPAAQQSFNFFDDAILPEEQLRVLQRAHLSQTMEPTDPHMMPLAESLFGSTWNLRQQHGSKVAFDHGAATDLIKGTGAKYTSLGKLMVFGEQYEPVLKRVMTGEGSDGYGPFQDIERLRNQVSLTATSPETRVAALHDVVAQLRDRLEVVDPSIPNLAERLGDSAFKNDAGQPIVFYHGATVDFDKNFDHVETRVFGNLLGPGLYTTDWDQPAFSYAIQAYSPWGPVSPNPRVQAFHMLVPQEKIMSLEMVGLGDPVGSRFIDGVYNNLEHTTARKQQLRVHTERLDGILVGDFLTSAERAKKGLVPSVGAELLRIAAASEATSGAVKGFRTLGREFLKSVKNLDFTVTDISKLFGDSALRKSHAKFAEEVEELVKTFGGSDDFRIALSDSAMGDFDLEEDLFKRIIAEASVVASRVQVEEELANLASKGIAPTKEQLKGLKNLEAQEEVILQSSNLTESVGGERQLIREAMGYDVFDQLENFNEVLQGKLTSPYTWQMAKSLSLNNLTKVPDDILTGSDFATWHLYNKRNRQFIQDIQDTYSSQVDKVKDIDARWVSEQTTQAKALKQLNAHYAEYNVEALTEIGGASQGAVPHRVAVLVGSNEVIQSNRVFVKLKTKPSFKRLLAPVPKAPLNQTDVELLRYGRGYVAGPDLLPSKTITGNPILDGSVGFEIPRSGKRSPYRTVNQDTDTKIVKVRATASKAELAKISASTSPQQTMRDLAKGRTPGSAESLLRQQETYQFSRAGTGPNRFGNYNRGTYDKPLREKVAFVSIHRAERVSPKRAERLGIEPIAGSDVWVMHTKSIDGAPELTLAERREIAATIKKNHHAFKYKGKKRQPSDIDVESTFNDVDGERARIDPAARESSSEQARSFYRENNPKGNDIDDTVGQGEIESSTTRLGRNLEEGIESVKDVSNKAVQEAMDKKLVASPRTVEGPAQASAEILDLQRKTELGLVISSYHGIPRKIASNLTPPQLDYTKYFGRNISDPINKDVLDFVITDTTGIYRKLDGTMTPEGESFIADRLLPEIQKRLDSEEYKTFRKQRDADIEAARTRGTAMILDAEEAAKLPKSDPAFISGVEKERRINVGKKLTKSDPGGFKPLKIHPLEVQALLNTGFERLKDIPASEGQAKLIRAFDRDGYATAIKKLIGVETPYVGSIADLEIAAAAPRLKGMSGTKPLKTAEVLAPHEVQFIWEALGLKTKDRSITPQTKLQILRDLFTQIFNLPRALLLSVDLGAIWNQGGMLIGGAVKPITTKRSLQHLAKGDFNAWYKGPDTLFYRNLGNAMTGMASSGNYRAQMDTLSKDVNYTYLTQKTNIHISDIDGPLSNREEAFLGNIFNSVGNVLPETVRKNPFMQKVAKVAGKASFIGYPFKAGERFHTLYLNKMRYEMLNDFNKGLVTSKIPEAKKVEALNSYADFLNKATGRGSLGKLDDLAPELSTILLAPRWMASRFQVPYTMAKTFGKESLNAMPKKFSKGGYGLARDANTATALKDAKAYAKKLGLQPTDVVESGDYFTVQGYKGAHTSKQMSQDLVRTFGVIGGIAGLLAMNGFEVETDWRKSSFLKINKGRINLDLTMGLGSVWRFVARAGYGVTGDRKEVSGSGIEFDADVMRQIGNFTRSKLSPLGASAAGVITGQNYFGEEVSGPSTFVPGQTTDYEDFLPLMVQQIKDSSEQMDGGFTQVLLGAGAVSGLNVGIYPDKDDIAMELAGIPYKELYGYEQKYINRMYYEGTEFVPSEYTQQTSKLENDQYEFIETIMAGNIPNGQKASRIYKYMNDQDLMLHGIRLAYFGEDRNSEEQPDPLKQAQNEYYELLGELNTPEKQALLTDEQLEKIKDRFLSTLTRTERDYILANKSNFMVPPSIGKLIKPDYEAQANREARNSRTRSALKAKGMAIPSAIKASSLGSESSKYYAVARTVMESNAARDRLSSGRTTTPSAEEQIELTRSIVTR